MRNTIKRLLALFLISGFLVGSLTATDTFITSKAQSGTTEIENMDMVREGTGSGDIATPSDIGQDDGIHIEREALIETEQPEQIPDENMVYTAGELEQWCSENGYAGGRGVLGGIITITETFSVFNSGHIVIDTGSYGLVYDGGSVSMSNYEITGEGVDFPVLDIQTVIERGYWWEAGWNDVVQDMNITAAGKDGIGGIALRIRQDDGYSPTYDYYLREGLIRSYGAGAIGLYLDEPLDVHCIQIQVAGDDSAAVYAPQGANLYYCKLAVGFIILCGSMTAILTLTIKSHIC